MDKKTRYKVNFPDVIHENVDNEVLIIEFDTGNYYSLDSSGADIWELLAAGIPADHIAKIIEKKYNAEDGEVYSAVEKLINELLEEKLIIPLEANGGDEEVSKNEVIPEAQVDLTFESPVLQKFSDMQELLLLDPIHEVDETGWPAPKKD